MSGEAASRTAGRQRWIGLVGSALLALGAVLAGAGPGPAPAGRAEALWGTGPEFRIGLLAYLAGLSLLAVAWWRLGKRLRDPAAPKPRWLLTTAALWAAPLLIVPPLGSRDLYAYACQGAVWLDGHDPYAVGAAAGGCPWVSAVPDLWQQSTAPYGPLALLASAGAVALARALVAGADGQLLVALGGLRAVALAGAGLVAIFGPRLARACGVAPGPALWLGLITPLVAVHGVAGAHNDALVAGLVVTGLALVAPGTGGPALGGGRWVLPAAAGAALGAAVAVKITAVVALPFAVILALGGARRGWAVGLLVATAAVTFGGLTAGTGLGLGWVAALSDTGSLVQWTSPPTGLGMAAGYLLWGLGWPGAYDPAVAVARLLALVALAVAGAALLIRAARRVGDTRAVVVAAGAALGATVLLGPVLYPWYALPPLAVLAAAVTSTTARRWLAAATLVLTSLVLPSGLGLAVLTKLPGALAVAVACAVVSWAWVRRRRAVAPLDQPPARSSPVR